MHRIALFISILFFVNFLVKAEQPETMLSGVNKTYAGKAIEVYSFTDLISNTPKLLASSVADSNGKFILNFPIAYTQMVSLPLGIFKAIMYIEPGTQYEVVLPDYQEKTKVDLLNPFFKPIEIYLGFKKLDTMNVNYQIAKFNEIYQGYLDRNYYYIFRNPLKANIDSVIETMETPFASYDNSYFQNFREYKYGWLKYITTMRDSRFLTKEYFNKKPVLYNNTAYMDLFNQVFANYLSMYLNTSEGQRLFSDIAYAKSPTFAYQTFRNNMVLLDDTIQELVLLKGLHDAFYGKDFPVQSLVITLDSMICCSKVPEHRLIASTIKQKVLQGRSGFKAPAFDLLDAKGVVHHIDDYKSNYVYLNFISIDSYTCREDLELLKALYEKHKSSFKVISISIDDDIKAVQEYFTQNGYEWDLLSASRQQNLPEIYHVKAYPAYYLISPDGKLAMSPANSPSENFEWYFFQMQQSKVRSENQHR